mmetsp:Transcript_19288/g.32679  ORF Transcript_19288/g.32679 Transcript_19288/m.32679 type:complete len:540 (+) Transcript_19288:68-1687(+)
MKMNLAEKLKTEPLFLCFVAAVAIGGCGIASALFCRALPKKTEKEIPAAAGYPIIGNLLDMDIETMTDHFQDLQKQYGPILTLEVFGQKFALVSSGTLLREVFAKRPKLLKRATSLEYMADKLGMGTYGLFHARDPKIWGRIRRLSASAFAKHQVVTMEGYILSEAESMVQRLTEAAEAGQEVNTVLAMMAYTTGVISRTAFGNDVGDYFFGDQFPTDMHNITFAMMESVIFPFPKWVWRLSSKYALEVRALEARDRFWAECKEIVVKKRAALAITPPEQKKELRTLLDALIKQEDSGGGITDDEIIPNVFTFFLAGSDTTAMALSWSLYLLTQHPEVLARVRAEIAPSFAAGNISANPGSSVGWAYTALVLKEAIRLYPAGPIVFLDFADPTSSSEPLVLSTGQVVSPGTTVLCGVKNCLMDPNVYTQPEQFNPSRWLLEEGGDGEGTGTGSGTSTSTGSGSSSTQLAEMESAFMAFGSGPRVCPGMGLAVSEGVLGLATIVHHFDFALTCPASEVKAEFKFTMQPSKLPMKFTRRSV